MENFEELIVNKLKEKKETISFMESCTGGYLANLITNVSGASNVLKTSLVTYSNEYKIKFGVPKSIIDEYTVYSNETANNMAIKACEFAKSNYGIGVTGELANSNIEDNKVYFSIYCKDDKSLISKKICVEPNKRDKMKIFVADKVLEELWNILMRN